MLHSDTNQDGKYEYLMMPGVDLPVVYNGGIVTVSASSGVIVPTIAPITPATTVPTIATTATATPAVSTTGTATEATAEVTGTAEVTETAEATETGTPEVTATLTATP